MRLTINRSSREGHFAGLCAAGYSILPPISRQTLAVFPNHACRCLWGFPGCTVSGYPTLLLPPGGKRSGCLSKVQQRMKQALNDKGEKITAAQDAPGVLCRKLEGQSSR